jgi:uncharacterized protein
VVWRHGLLQTMDTAMVRRWAVIALAALGEAREEIDALNVFPVPDGDTGTNMYLTLESAVTAAATVPADAPVAQLADSFARGALMGARGNSGVIGSQFLRGWADALSEFTEFTAETAAEGFRRADEQAWHAVNEPVEGTILSVSRAAAHAATQSAGQAPDDLPGMIEAAAAAARRALALTPGQLPALARAGVVDAGGRGLVVVLDSLAEVITGATRRMPSRSQRPAFRPAADTRSCTHHVEGGPSYEVMYLLDADDEAIGMLRDRLAGLGDSLVTVGGSGLWSVHVHVHDPGAAIEAGIEVGRPHRVRISHFSEHGKLAPARQQTTGAGLVACAAGPGLADLFESAGAIVVPGGPGRRASTGELLAAVRRTGTSRVALLPNDGDTLAVAQAAAAAARSEGIRVTVVPTRAQVQGIAAAAVHDPVRDFDDDVVSMSSAAGAARDGAVTIAARAGLTTAGECAPGDVLGVVDGDFAVVGTSLHDVAVEVLSRLLSGGGELVTLVVGAGGHEGLAKSVAAALRTSYRRLEVIVLNGGQPRYPLLIGVE